MHHGPLILLAQALLILRRLGALEHFARRLTDGGENLRDGFGARDLAVLAKVGATDRILALQRIEIEWRVAPSLRREDRPQQKRTPSHRHARLRRDLLDPRGGQV